MKEPKFYFQTYKEKDWQNSWSPSFYYGPREKWMKLINIKKIKKKK